jgi:hypothetical protein
MVDFIATILEIKTILSLRCCNWTFRWNVVLNARLKKVNHAVVIGSGDIVEDIIDDFIAKLD